MNNETLSEILGAMAYAAISDRAMLYHDFSREQISEAEEKLDKLIERDTPKKPLNQKFNFRTGQTFGICQTCSGSVNDLTMFYSCKCGQRLKWSE